MFLRIDKVIGVPNSPPIPTNDSLHACLATAATTPPNNVEGPVVIPNNDDNNNLNASGELLIVGRKNAAVTIDDKVRFPSFVDLLSICHCQVVIDLTSTMHESPSFWHSKCVSRKHASIHLLSKTPHTNNPNNRPEILHDRVIMEYGTPSSPEEIAACDSSPNGIICVVRDLGSKFGECC